jgi:nucleotide-binding universal stress UspA family protein
MLQVVRRLARSHEVFSRILAANDGSTHGFKALTAAVDVALACEAELHMIVVEEVPLFPGSIAEVRGEIEMAQSRFAPTVAKSKNLAAEWGVSLQCHMVPGRPASAIVEFARERSCDLIVIGLASHTLLHRLVGSTAQRVVEKASCAVLVVK